MTTTERFKKVINFLKTGQIWLAIFVFAFVAVNTLVFSSLSAYSPYSSEKYFSFGGPVIASGDYSGAVVGSAVYYEVSDSYESPVSLIFVENALAVGNSYPFSNVLPSRDGLLRYKVQKGDTLSEIAAQFGVSLNTIKWANPGVGSFISPGQELIILPVSGILYEIEEGDTLESVASRYKINSELIRKYNPDYQKLFESPKSIIILPYAKPLNQWSYMNKYRKNLPRLNNYFKLPARGWNWGKLHHYNAVDVAAPCGEPIYAAAEGLVVESSGNNYWNDGYGNYILIEHPNGTKTRYAHTLKNFVVQGDYVLQGEEIALIGKSGKIDGFSGCHLHFEVYGAQNPFSLE